MPPKSKKSPQISDKAVQKATGRVWQDWFSILDKAGGRKKNHQEIVACLNRYEIGSWWQQMVTVNYERARGLRVKHQRPDWFEISVSRTISVPAAESFQAWEDSKARSKWLNSNPLDIRKSTPNKSIRLVWADRKSRLDVQFFVKGKGKSQVVVQHSKLPDAKTARKMKIFWGGRLDRLRDILEK